MHLWVWKRATEVAAGWREMKEGARGRVRLQAKRPRLGTICKHPSNVEFISIAMHWRER